MSESDPRRYCITRHILDAIRLNWNRMGRYAGVDAAARKISLCFISGQILSLPNTFRIDVRALFWQRRGIPLLFCDLVSMSKAPAFSERAVKGAAPLSSFVPLAIEQVEEPLQRAIEAQQFDSAASSLRTALNSVMEPHCFNAMSRHMLESLLRSAVLAPWYEDVARTRQLPSPGGVMQSYLRSQLRALYGCRMLDRLAAPLQARGIPMLLHDVPPIETDPVYLRQAFERGLELFSDVRCA